MILQATVQRISNGTIMQDFNDNSGVGKFRGEIVGHNQIGGSSRDF